MAANGENPSCRNSRPLLVQGQPSPYVSWKSSWYSSQTRLFRPHSIYTWTRPQANHSPPSSDSSQGHMRTPSIRSHNQCFGSSNTHVGRNSTHQSMNFSAEPNTCISSPTHFTATAISTLHSTPRHSKTFLLQSPAVPLSLPVSPSLSVSSISKNSALNSLYTTLKEETDFSSAPRICSCHRSFQLILCKSCGNILTGRIRKQCSVHPKQVFLMDLLCCTECHSKNLKEMSNAKPPKANQTGPR